MEPTVKIERRTLAQTFLRKYFERAIRYEASDLLMRGDYVPRLRVRGSLKALNSRPITSDSFEAAIRAGLSNEQWETYNTRGSVDLGVNFELDDGSIHRFRVNVYRSRGQSSLAARRVNNTILNFEQLNLPSVLGQVCDHHQGLILMCGVTGSGKSTTLASMLQSINERRACHILTIEDPIEYMFTDEKAMISQREVGIDVPNYEDALRSLVRENPDVVLIGELRDKETFEAALQASETGHLVFGTIHASSASQAFGRIYDLFPATERDGIRTLLAYQMQAFVFQKLLPSLRKDLQRVPAVEILLQSAPTRKYILEGREHELDDVIKRNRDSGMQTFTDSLVDLVQRQLVHPKDAQAAAISPEELKLRLRGIVTGTN